MRKQKSWLKSEDKKLMELVTTYKEQGLKIKAIFKKIAPEFDVKDSAIQGRYYLLKNESNIDNTFSNKKVDVKLLIQYVETALSEDKKVKDGILKYATDYNFSYIKVRGYWDQYRTISTRKRTDWTKEEDEKLLQILIKETNEGVALSDACTIAAKKLKRTQRSCLGRWNNELKEHHEDKIILAVSRWSDLEEKKLINIIKNETNKGKTLGEAFETASKQMNRTTHACESRYNEFRDERVKYGISVGKWVKEEEIALKNIIFENLENNNVTECLKIAAKKLGKTQKATWMRWYYYVLPENQDEYMKLRQKYGILQGRPVGTKVKQTTWKDEEITILQQCLKEAELNKNTIESAMRIASEKLENRSLDACKFKMYKLNNKVM